MNIRRRLVYRFQKEGKPLDEKFNQLLESEIQRFENQQTQQVLHQVQVQEQPKFLEQIPFESKPPENRNYWENLQKKQIEREIELSGKPQQKTFNENGSYKTSASEGLTENAVTIPFNKINEYIGYTESGAPFIKQPKKKKTDRLECWEDLT